MGSPAPDHTNCYFVTILYLFLKQINKMKIFSPTILNSKVQEIYFDTIEEYYLIRERYIVLMIIDRDQRVSGKYYRPINIC